MDIENTQPGENFMGIISHAELAFVNARVEQLEKQNRIFKWVALLALALALFLGVNLFRHGLLYGRDNWSSFKTVDAERLVMRDGDGKMRAMIWQDENKGPVLRFWNDAELILPEITTQASSFKAVEAEEFVLRDQERIPRVRLVYDEKKERPILRLLDKEGNSVREIPLVNPER